jgi:hypothetical protein
MKKILLFSVLFYAIFGRAQNYYNAGSGGSAMYHMYYMKDIDFDNRYNPFTDNKESILKDQGITSLEIKSFSRNGKLRHSEIRFFNESGKLISIESNDVKINYTYQDDTLLFKVEKFTPREKIIIERSYEGKNLKSVNYKCNDKDIYSENYAFTSSGKILQSKVVHFKKKRTYEMNFSYNDQNQLTKTDYLYNNKLIKSWNHECKPEGVDAKPQKDVEVNVCKFNEENRDGSYIVYTRRIQNKTNSLQKDYYTIDSLLFKTETYVNDSILQNRYIYNKEEKITERYRNGKMVYKHIEQYNDQNMVTNYTFYKRNKGKYTTNVLYNADKTISTTERSVKGQLRRKTVYIYSKE